MREEIVDSLVTDLEGSGVFKRVYKNLGLHWSQIKEFPAAAVIYESEEKELDNLSSRACYYKGVIQIAVYNKQPKNKYDDILSELIDEVYRVIENNEILCCKVVRADVAGFKRDGGIAHPHAVALISVYVRYKLAL